MRIAAPLFLVILLAPTLASAGPRADVVRLDGTGFVDDGGPFPALGASLFWAVWGFKQDRARLEENLETLAGHDVDFIRYFAQVGPKYWEDRTVDPHWPDYDEMLAGAIDLAYAHGLRTELTIFGGTDNTPDPASRRAFVERVCTIVRPRAEKVIFIEIANEYYHDSIFGLGGEPEIRTLAALVQSALPNLVTLSAPRSDEEGCALYGPTPPAPASPLPSASSLQTTVSLGSIHFSRDIHQAEGPWRPVRLPWDYPPPCFPRAGVNNEPIGPGASVASDEDPTRLIAAAISTFLAGLPAYVYHSHAGIWGGGQRSHGEVNLLDHPTAAATLAGYARMKQLLPPDVATWEKSAAGRLPFFHPHAATTPPQPSLPGIYATCHAGRCIALLIGVKDDLTFTAASEVVLRVYGLPALSVEQDLSL
ncbi:MAG: hypothetical protein HYV26_11230, partial [Candidatus Hydrogenedentes bacterium]|nr:hypothetical protein [Candidatus Hydrogenedentota bacterium]